MRMTVGAAAALLVLAVLATVSVPGVRAEETAYNEQLAYRAMLYSGIAYCPNFATIENWTCQFCSMVTTFTFVTDAYDSNTNVYGYLGIDTEYQMSTSSDRTANWEEEWG